MQASTIALVAALCICGVIAGFSIMTVFRMSSQISDLQADYEDLEAQNEQTQNSLQSLQSSYNVLNGNYNQLESQYNDLEAQNEQTQNSLQSLQSSYNVLNGDYNQLKSQYNDLQTNYQISEMLGIGHLLADYYSVVRDSHTDYWESPGWWYFGGGEQDTVDFAANLAKHNLGRIYWPDKEDKYYEFADEYSYTTAMRELNEIYDLIWIQFGDSSVERIRKILSFVNTYVHYESDYNNAFLAPVETLAFKSGDCDDYSILAAALFEKAGIDSAIGFFESKSGDIAHAMVLVHLDSLSPYGYWYYSDLTNKGLSAGKWIMIEPQATIEDQHTPSWFEQWSIRVAAEV